MKSKVFVKSYILRKASKKEKIKGGYADGQPDDKYDAKQLAMGIKIEMEHTDDKDKAREIAKDHLEEIPDYYTRLRRMEAQAEKEGKKVKKSDAKAFAHQFKKSYDYRDLAVQVDANDQEAAEKSACPKLIEYIKSGVSWIEVDESRKLEFCKGDLTLYKKAEGLYSGFFTSNEDGEVLDKYDDLTPELIAKNLEIKLLDPYPIPTDELEEVPVEAPLITENSETPSYIKVRMGDFEMELKKSVNAFVKNYSNNKKMIQKPILVKALKSWKRRMEKSMHLPTMRHATEELLENWEMHQEGFSQIVFAIQQIQKERSGE
jgi:hypothetical protein